MKKLLLYNSVTFIHFLPTFYALLLDSVYMICHNYNIQSLQSSPNFVVIIDSSNSTPLVQIRVARGQNEIYNKISLEGFQVTKQAR